MGIMRKTLIEKLRKELSIPVWETRGYITKGTRVELLKLPKSHINDALDIAQGRGGFNITKPGIIARTDRQYTVKPTRHHNRQIHKAKILKGGIRKINQAPKFVKLLDGSKVKDGVGYKRLALLERGSSYLIM